MSWNGAHCSLTKAQVKGLLPPATCKDCVYWFRYAIGTQPENWYLPDERCGRCAIPRAQHLRMLTAMFCHSAQVGGADARKR